MCLLGLGEHANAPTRGTKLFGVRVLFWDMGKKRIKKGMLNCIPLYDLLGNYWLITLQLELLLEPQLEQHCERQVLRAFVQLSFC